MYIYTIINMYITDNVTIFNLGLTFNLGFYKLKIDNTQDTYTYIQTHIQKTWLCDWLAVFRYTNCSSYFCCIMVLNMALRSFVSQFALWLSEEVDRYSSLRLWDSKARIMLMSCGSSDFRRSSGFSFAFFFVNWKRTISSLQRSYVRYSNLFTIKL